MIPNGIITGYVVYITYANRSVDVFNTYGQITSYNVTNLIPHQQISIAVAATTHIGEGPTSAMQFTRTAQAGMTYVHQTSKQINHIIAEASTKCILWCIVKVMHDMSIVKKTSEASDEYYACMLKVLWFQPGQKLRTTMI